MARIEILEYDPRWPTLFGKLRDQLWPHVCDIASRIEHVGSTSVPGLAAKPAIDLDIVVPSIRTVTVATSRLIGIGYTHRTHLSVPDRAAFKCADELHNLYVCVAGGNSLRNHTAFRDHLRTNPETAAAYSALKKELAHRFPNDRIAYIEGKTHFILAILAKCGLSQEQLLSIRESNEDLYEGLKAEVAKE